tara:strand:- start:9590 stop:9766 length:177 start_codon:yes stop_codon:yes gene_type:complete
MKSIKNINQELMQFNISVKEEKKGICTVYTDENPYMIISKKRLQKIYPKLMNSLVKLS